MKKMILSIFFIFLAADAFSCNLSAPASLNLAVSTREEKIFAYGVKNVDEKLPVSVVTNCRETANKRRFVMVTFGPELVAQNDAIRGTNFDNQFVENNSCFIKNNPLTEVQSRSDIKKDFDRKWKFIKECSEIQVTELGQRALNFPIDQAGCKVEKINDKSAKFSGGFCFFKPSQDSEWHISVTVKDSCKGLKGYQDSGVNLLDLEASVGLYTSSAYKDEINDLSAFGSYPVRLSIGPSEELMKVSDDFGVLRPTFPDNYTLQDLHLGKIEVLNQDDKNVIIKTPFIVGHACKEVAKKGLVSSLCNYSLPVVGEVFLKNLKGEEIASWFDGGIASTQWQGILNGEGKQVSKDLVKPNQDYIIEINFSDPYFDFNTFKKRVKSKIQRSIYGLPPLSNGGIITDIPTLGEIGEIGTMIDILPIGEIDFRHGLSDLGDSRKRLGAYFSTTLYPPMYSKACQQDKGLCVNVGEPFVKFTARFKISDDYSLSKLEIERHSPLLGNYKKKIEEQPEYICQ